MSQQLILEELVKRMNVLDNRVAEIAVDRKQFEIRNLSPLYSLASNSNNFPVTDFDTLFILPTANYTINGLTNGFSGRLLFIFNASPSFTISFTYQNASAVAANRIVTPTLGTITLPTRQMAMFQYTDNTNVVSGGSRWIMFLPTS